MTTRSSSTCILGALAFSFVVATTLLAPAQTGAPAEPMAPAPATSAPASPAPVAPVAAPADTNAPAATAPAERPTSYTVVEHDSLWLIAHKYGTTVVKLRKLNNLKKGALLHPGQVLQIPPAPSDTTTK